MLYMITATYKGKDGFDFQEYVKARLPKLPDGVKHGVKLIDAWVGVNVHRCFQLVETSDENLLQLQEWTMQLDDLFKFEVDHVVHLPLPGENNC